MTIKAIIHKEEGDGGYWAEVPSFPGCFTQGDTLEELTSNIQEAVEAWLLAGEPEAVEPGSILEVAV